MFYYITLSSQQNSNIFGLDACWGGLSAKRLIMFVDNLLVYTLFHPTTQAMINREINKIKNNYTE